MPEHHKEIDVCPEELRKHSAAVVVVVVASGTVVVVVVVAAATHTLEEWRNRRPIQPATSVEIRVSVVVVVAAGPCKVQRVSRRSSAEVADGVVVVVVGEVAVANAVAS